MLESAKDLTIEAAVSASARLTETPSAKRPQEICKLLNSRTERDVLSGMKCVIALISRGEDGISYFADVVKNVTLLNARVRALVMVYIQKYADREPDTALLSINSIQKSLSDKSPRNRAASIRTLGGIQIPEIASLLILCIKRTVMDLSPIVRAATALAIGKAYKIEGINRKQLFKDLATLLGDASPQVVGAAVKVFVQLKPLLIKVFSGKTWHAIHSNYQNYIRILPELDPWSESTMIDLLVEYARLFLPKPELVLSDGSRMELPLDFSRFPEDYLSEYDTDLEAFLNALRHVGYCDSPQVILAALRALVLLGTPKHISAYGIAEDLIRISLLSPDELTRLYTLQCISVLSLSAPTMFRNNARKFFLSGDDSLSVAECKLFILLCLFSEANGKSIMLELKYNAIHERREVAREAVKAIGRCSQSSVQWGDKILRWSVAETARSASSPIMAELLTVIRYILQQRQCSALDENHLIKTLYKLSVLLSSPEQKLDTEAKSSIIWIIGEFTEATKNVIGPDVLRRCLKTFVREPEKVRYELLILAAKSYSYEIRIGKKRDITSPIGKMFHYVVHLARYDSSFITRDRVRMLEQLFKDVSNHQLATLFLQVPKPAPVYSKYQSPITASLSAYLRVPKWADTATHPPKSVRKETVPQTSRFKGFHSDSVPENLSHKTLALSSDSIGDNLVTIAASKINQLQSLDEFFGNVESDEESEEESESESEDDSEENSDLDSNASGEEVGAVQNSDDSHEYLSSDDSDGSDVALVGTNGKVN